MSARCWSAQSLLARRREGLADADRLVLEEHLSRCARCTEDAAVLDRMSAAVDAGDRELAPGTRRRIVARALSRSQAAAPVVSARPRAGGIAISAALAATFLAVLAVVVVRRDAPTVAAVGLEAATRGRADGLQPAPDTPAPVASADAPLPPPVEAPRGTTMDLGTARVSVLEDATLRWNEAADALELLKGGVRIDVEPRADRAFRVLTERFVVEVVGTSFEVDAERVRVSRGRVRVLASAGDDVLADLAAGQAWTWRETAMRPAPADDVGARIADARRRLATGRVAEARATLETVLRRSLTRAQQAEARSLLAECALADGDFGKAARVYGEVATSQTDTLAGETALFSQARAQMRAGQRREARQTLLGYVKRFPDGRFRKEALEHLRALGDAP